nr:feather beta keratin-like [Anas platyrhynchos]
MTSVNSFNLKESRFRLDIRKKFFTLRMASPFSLPSRSLLLTPTTPTAFPTPSLPGTLHTTDMSCYNLCNPCGPTPLANSCNEPCVRQCEDSHVAIQPSTVVVTLPGPILSSFPQNTAVGSSASAAVGSNLSAQGVPISGGGFGGFGLGGLGGYGLGGLGCFSGRRACYPC